MGDGQMFSLKAGLWFARSQELGLSLQTIPLFCDHHFCGLQSRGSKDPSCPGTYQDARGTRRGRGPLEEEGSCAEAP